MNIKQKSKEGKGGGVDGDGSRQKKGKKD